MLIGFSGKALSGKDTAADYLISKYNWSGKLGFSYNLKEACAEIFDLSHEQVFDQKGKNAVLAHKVVMDFSLLNSVIDWINRTHKVSIYSKEYRHLLGEVFDTPREILQFVGTDIMRYYCPSYHVDVALIKAQELNRFSSVSFVDVRFPNEAAGIKSIGGFLVRVSRPDTLRALYGSLSISAHLSEVALDGKNDWDYVLYNDTNVLSDYYYSIDAMLKTLEEKNASSS